MKLFPLKYDHVERSSGQALSCKDETFRRVLHDETFGNIVRCLHPKLHRSQIWSFLLPCISYDTTCNRQRKKSVKTRHDVRQSADFRLYDQSRECIGFRLKTLSFMKWRTPQALDARLSTYRHTYFRVQVQRNNNRYEYASFESRNHSVLRNGA